MTAFLPPSRPYAPAPPATVTRLVPPQRPGWGPAGPEVQGTLALDLRGSRRADLLPTTPELDPTRRSRIDGVADAEVRGWAATFAQAVVEMLAGQRPVSQLVRWTTAQVYRDLDRRVQLLHRAGGGGATPGAPGPARARVSAQVRSVHVCRPTPEAAEVSVHLRHGHRSRAVALRMERRQDRWVCTVLEFV